MRILHLCQPTDGGTAVVTRDLVRAGVEAGDDVTVGCPADGYLADWVRDAGARWIELPLTRAPSWRDLLLVARVRRLMLGADVVHLQSSKAGAVGRLAAATLRGRRPRIIFTPHAWSWYVGGRLAGVYRRFEHWAARETDVFTVVSAEEGRAGRAVLPPGVRIELIENGVDTSVFAPDGPIAERGPEPLVVQVGRLSRQKGQDRAIRALARCPSRSTRLRLVGDGPDESALRALAGELGVAERVEFTGSADPRPHLRAADVVVLPSRWEGRSLVLLEAMAVGAAVVATGCGDSADVLGDAGRVLAHEEDADVVGELAGVVAGLLADAAQRQDLRRRARLRVEQRYPLRAGMQRYVTLWHSA